jgi:hypothetical protein
MLGDGSGKRIVYMAHFATMESLTAGLSLFTQVRGSGILRTSPRTPVDGIMTVGKFNR